MTSENVTEAETVELSEPKPSRAVDDRLIDELVSRAQAEGLQLTGEGGLLQHLTKRLLEPGPEHGLSLPVSQHEIPPGGCYTSPTRSANHRPSTSDSRIHGSISPVGAASRLTTTLTLRRLSSAPDGPVSLTVVIRTKAQASSARAP
jgi:hypothetical protein